MDFCKKFNEATKHETPGIIIPVRDLRVSGSKFDFVLSSRQPQC